MKSRIAAGLLVAALLPALAAAAFKEEQLKYPRVRRAYAEKEAGLRELFRSLRLAYPPRAIFLRAFKYEHELELWVSDGGRFALAKSYRICALSGVLGPKRREGDLQVPEGFYRVSGFNPVSRFHLSLKVDYPNASDAILGMAGRLGGTIFIHGSCVTIGCIPILDSNIKEVYLLAVEARSAGQGSIPVHIFPARLTTEKLETLRRLFSPREELRKFWENLREGYDYFEREKRLPVVRAARDGRYLFGR